jgi:hypothetical protein
VLLYAVTVPADSGSLTAGMSATANPQVRGVTLALHSAVGFGLSGVAGWAVGVALDHFGGAQQPGGVDGRIRGASRRRPVWSVDAVVVARPANLVTSNLQTQVGRSLKLARFACV